MKKTWTITFLVLSAMFLLGSERSSAHGGIVIDGDCTTDWGSAAPVMIHTSQVVAGPGGTEWVYLGAPGDARDDTGGTSSNNDIVQVRFTGDSTYLYFCVKMTNITDVWLPNINLAVDTDHSALDEGLNWAGDETCSTCGVQGSYTIPSPVNFIERQFNAHFNGSNPFEIETAENIFYIFDDNPDFWFNGGLNTVAASDVFDNIEGKIAWMYLGCTGPCNELSVNLTSYRNEPGINDSLDTTYDLVDGDGIDVMGGTPALIQNAWDREFSDGALSNFHTIRFDNPTAIDLRSASARAQFNPGLIFSGMILLSLFGLMHFRRQTKR